MISIHVWNLYVFELNYINKIYDKRVWWFLKRKTLQNYFYILSRCDEILFRLFLKTPLSHPHLYVNHRRDYVVFVNTVQCVYRLLQTIYEKIFTTVPCDMERLSWPVRYIDSCMLPILFTLFKYFLTRTLSFNFTSIYFNYHF